MASPGFVPTLLSLPNGSAQSALHVWTEEGRIFFFGCSVLISTPVAAWCYIGQLAAIILVNLVTPVPVCRGVGVFGLAWHGMVVWYSDNTILPTLTSVLPLVVAD